MGLALTDAARLASQGIAIQPQLVFEIDGVPTIYGAVPVTRYIKVGDPALLIGNTWTIGGLGAHDSSESLISLQGTGTKIQQQLMPDKGAVTSASSVKVELLDSGNLITRLISPGQVVDDLLGRRAKLWMGFKNTAFPEDFVEIFAGTIDELDSGPGNVQINLVHPDQKKRQQIFLKLDAVLSAGINAVVTSIPIALANETFLPLPTGGDGLVDSSIRHFVKIEEEVIEYTGVNSTHLTGCTRGALDTTANPHAIEAATSSFYVLEGATMDLALKLMLSGWNGPYLEGKAALGLGAQPFSLLSSSVNQVILPVGVDAESDYGVRVGSYIRVVTTLGTGAWNEVTELQDLEGESNRVILFADSEDTILNNQEITLDFRSQYDTLGQGLRLAPFEVDIDEHIRWRDIALSDYQYRFYMRDTVNGKDFLEQEIYLPYGSYAIPRKGKCSVGFHIGPLPQVDLAIFDKTNIKNPQKIRIKRSTSKNFYNAIIYKYDESVATADKFQAGFIELSAESQSRIPIGNAAFTIKSKGMRSDLEANPNAAQSADRRLNRYKYGAEYFDNIETFFQDGWAVEPGDLAIIDFTDLKVSNTLDGTREKPAKFFEVINKTLDLKTGAVSFSLVDTNYDASERYGLISPSSLVATGSTTTRVVIEASFGEYFGASEWKKWRDYVGLPIRVHSEDFSFDETVTFLRFDPANNNKLVISPATPLSIPPTAGMIVDLPLYSDSPEQRTNRLYKLIHAHQSPQVTIVSGTDDFTFEVDPADAAKFFAGAPCRIHNTDFSIDSDEVRVESVDGTTVVVDASLGFTPSAGQFADLLGFADGDSCYRWI